MDCRSLMMDLIRSVGGMGVSLREGRMDSPTLIDCKECYRLPPGIRCMEIHEVGLAGLYFFTKG